MSEHITHTQEIKRLERSSSDRLIAGVSSGLGRYFDLNPAVFRLGFVVLTLLGGAGILTYLVAVLVIPEEGAEQSIAARVLAERRTRPWPLVGLGLVAAAVLVLLSRAAVWPVRGAGWVLVLLAGLAILWTFDANRGNSRSRRLLAVLVSLVALVAVVLVAAVITMFAWFNVSLSDGVGDHYYTPETAAAVQPSYDLGVGTLRLDLTDIGPIETPLHVKAKVGVGNLWITVPRGVDVRVDAHAKVGDVHALSLHDDGHNAAVHTGGTGTLQIQADVGAGKIDVVRAGS